MTKFNYMGVCMSDRTPPENLTDELWQEVFAKFKKLPRRFGRGNLMPKPPRAKNGFYSTYEMYVRFINDILRNIRQGETDYCYFLYHIQDLVEYEPLLESRFVEDGRYFEVWIKQDDVKPVEHEERKQRDYALKIKKPFKNKK